MKALVSFLTDGLCSQKTARTEKNESQGYYFGVKVFMSSLKLNACGRYLEIYMNLQKCFDFIVRTSKVCIA